MWQSRLFVSFLLVSAPFVLESAFEAYGLTLALGPQMIFFSIIHTGGILVLFLLASGACMLLSIVSGLALLAVRRFSETTRTLPSRVIAIATMALSVHAGLIMTYDWWSPLWPARLMSIAALVYLTWAAAQVIRSYRLTNGWSTL
jgi:hypothetical protein